MLPLYLFSHAALAPKKKKRKEKKKEREKELPVYSLLQHYHWNLPH